jgi:membrane-associated protease RseP (regulator of RpoE activity)
MPEKESSSNTIPSTAKLKGVIMMLTILIKIVRYLPWIVLAFAAINMIIAVLYFTWWHSMTGGILNLILGIAGFVFFAQLIRMRWIRRRGYNYRYTRNDPYRETNMTEQREVSAESAETRQQRSVDESNSIHTKPSS